MSSQLLKWLAVFPLSFFTMFCAAQEEAHPTSSSSEFLASVEDDLSRLIQADFHDELVTSSLGATSADTFNASLETIKSQWKELATHKGDANVTYDVILQAGHYLRETGATGASGKYVSEQELVAYIVKVAADHLRDKHGLNVLTLSADHYTPGLTSKLFLAVHADGSVKPCKTGPSLSYQTSSSTLAMHAIGWALSQALGYRYEDFRKDGFTANAAKYYMYSKIDAPVMKGLLEVGEITCDKVEPRLIVSADGIAANVATAISFVLSTQPAASPATALK